MGLLPPAAWGMHPSCLLEFKLFSEVLPPLVRYQEICQPWDLPLTAVTPKQREARLATSHARSSCQVPDVAGKWMKRDHTKGDEGQDPGWCLGAGGKDFLKVMGRCHHHLPASGDLPVVPEGFSMQLCCISQQVRWESMTASLLLIWWHSLSPLPLL